MTAAVARDADHPFEALLQRFLRVRQRSVDLVAPLSAEAARADRARLPP